MEMFMPLLINAAIIISIIVFIYKKITLKAIKKDNEINNINERLKKIERDIEELKDVFKKS